MSLVDSIIDKTVEIALSGRSRIATCAAYGVSCEWWLKTELLHALDEALTTSSEVEVLPEAKNIDLTVRTRTEQVLLELKTFPTNYGRSGKPITNFIDGVLGDLRKLARLRGSTGIGLAIWMAYVIPDPVPTPWAGHVAKIQAVAAGTRRDERIPLWENAFANLYIMNSR